MKKDNLKVTLGVFLLVVSAYFGFDTFKELSEQNKVKNSSPKDQFLYGCNKVSNDLLAQKMDTKPNKLTNSYADVYCACMLSVIEKEKMDFNNPQMYYEFVETDIGKQEVDNCQLSAEKNFDVERSAASIGR